MQHILVFIRDVPDYEAEKIKNELKTVNEHSHESFYPYRNLLRRYGFEGGEVAFIEDSIVVTHTLINVKDSVLNLDYNKEPPEIILTNHGDTLP